MSCSSRWENKFYPCTFLAKLHWIFQDIQFLIIFSCAGLTFQTRSNGTIVLLFWDFYADLFRSGWPKQLPGQQFGLILFVIFTFIILSDSNFMHCWIINLNKMLWTGHCIMSNVLWDFNLEKNCQFKYFLDCCQFWFLFR